MSGSQDRFIITADEAESLLPEGEYIHTIAGGRRLILGCDWSREGAVKALREAVQIELGGPERHPIIVWDTETHHYFFQADMDKVDALEASRVAAGAP